MLIEFNWPFIHIKLSLNLNVTFRTTRPCKVVKLQIFHQAWAKMEEIWTRSSIIVEDEISLLPKEDQMKARFKYNKMQRDSLLKLQQNNGSFRNKINNLSLLELNPEGKPKRPSSTTPNISWFKKGPSSSKSKRSYTNEEIKREKSIDRKAIRLFKRKKIKTKNYIEKLEIISKQDIINNLGLHK